MNTAKRIVLAGGTGFIGSALAAAFRARGYDVSILTRSPRPRTDSIKEISWNGEHLGEWISALDGADVVINLSGANVSRPHTPENIREILDSRVKSVHAIAAAIEHVKIPPKVWLQASAVGYYGNSGDRICDEDAPPGNDTLTMICKQWETAFNSAKNPKTRKVLMRIGFVLGHDGGALPIVATLTKWFLGGRAGSGQHFISWIHIADLARMFIEAAEVQTLYGTFNAVGPEPATNAEFMRTLRKVLHRPWSPSVPEFAIRIGARLMKTEPSLALAGCRCVPKRFQENNFRFQFNHLRTALEEIYH